jgi:hypothetical protein
LMLGKLYVLAKNERLSKLKLGESSSADILTNEKLGDPEVSRKGRTDDGPSRAELLTP